MDLAAIASVDEHRPTAAGLQNIVTMKGGLYKALYKSVYTTRVDRGAGWQIDAYL